MKNLKNTDFQFRYDNIYTNYTFCSSNEQFPSEGIVALVIVNRFKDTHGEKNIVKMMNKQFKFKEMLELCAKRQEIVLNMVPLRNVT